MTLQISFKRILTWKALRDDSESGIIKRRVSTGNDKHNLERQRETLWEMIAQGEMLWQFKSVCFKFDRCTFKTEKPTTYIDISSVNSKLWHIPRLLLCRGITVKLWHHIYPTLYRVFSKYLHYAVEGTRR